MTGSCANEDAADVLPQSLVGQTHIVTGGDSSVGMAAVEAIASAGATVIIASRSSAKGEAAAERIRRETGALVTFVPVDLASFASVRRAAVRLRHVVSQAGNGRLDSLILCAGVLGVQGDAADTWITAAGLESTMMINYFSHALLVEELLPLLRASTARVVEVSSSASIYPCDWQGGPPSLSAERWLSECTSLANIAWASHTLPTGDSGMGLPAPSTYGLSKFAQVVHAKQLAEREPSLLAFSVNPGLVSRGSTMVSKGVPAATEAEWCRWNDELYAHACPYTASQGAATLVYLATGDAVALAASNGGFFADCTVRDADLNDGARLHGGSAYASAFYNLTLDEIARGTRAEQLREVTGTAEFGKFTAIAGGSDRMAGWPLTVVQACALCGSVLLASGQLRRSRQRSRRPEALLLM